MKTLDVSAFDQGVRATIQDIIICKSKMEELERIIRQFIALEDSFKGNAAHSMRLFYATCHQPFIILLQQFLHQYDQILHQLQAAVHTYESEINGYIQQAFIEGEVDPKLEKLLDIVQNLTTKANSMINEVSDIVTLPHVNNHVVLEKIQEGKEKSKKTVEQLYELDHSQTEVLKRIFTETNKIQKFIEKSSTLLHNGNISVTDFQINSFINHEAYDDLLSKIHPLYNGFYKFVNILSAIEPLIMFLHPSRILPTIFRGKEVNDTELDTLKDTEFYQNLAEKNKLTPGEEAVLRDYLQNLDPNNTFNPDEFEMPDYGPITFEDKRKVMGGNSRLAGSPDGLVGFGMIVYYVTIDDAVTILDPDATIDEKLLAGIFLVPTPLKFGKPLLKSVDDIAGGVKGIDNPLLPTEGKVGTFKELAKQGTAFDNITPHHMPSAAKMKQAGVKRNDGVSMNMEQPHPGVGGRHRETYTYGLSGNKLEEYLNLSYRDALTHDILDARRIYMKNGIYTPEIRAGLLNTIRKNKELYPELFNK